MALLTEHLKTWIGREAHYPAHEELGRASIRYFALALGDDNPLYLEDEYAREAGYPSVIAPPTLICETCQYANRRPDADGYIGHEWKLPIDGCRLIRATRPALALLFPFLVRARARPRGQRFRSGGTGIKLRGSFVARRSKPLAAGGGCGVCAFRHFRLARPCSLSLGVRAPRRRAANEEKTRRLLINRPGLCFNEEFDSKRTSARQQLDCAKTLV